MFYLRNIFPLLILIFTAASCLGITPQEAVDKFLAEGGVQKESVAVKIIDLSNGKVIASHNTTTPLVPASIMKSVTTAAFLESVGPDWRYHTRVYVDGPNDLGYLRGNIIVEGNCDPTINSTYEPLSKDFIQEIVKSLSDLRINRIEGSIIIDENNFSGPPRPASWAKEDVNKYYGTGSHAFNFSDNANGDHAVHNPSQTFTNGLKKALEAKGIELEDKPLVVGRRIQILDHLSAPVDEIMRSCMMRSDNMFAESMLRTYGKMGGGDGSTSDAAQTIMALWKKKKLPLNGVQIVDGSGLSRTNRVTADFMGALLSGMSENPHYASFFPLAGQEGTLRKFLANTPLDSYVAMKTGSMRGIQCFAGYKLDDDYVPTHVIVIIMNELGIYRDKAKEAAQNMLLSVFE